MKTKITFGILLLFLVGIAYAYPLHYTGYVVNLKTLETFPSGRHISLGLDGNGDGGAEFQAEFYCVSSDAYQTLNSAKQKHLKVRITYHSEYGFHGLFLILDDVVIIGTTSPVESVE